MDFLGYHGTTEAAGLQIIAKVDVSRGDGEFGVGFYTQTSRPNAFRWALTRGPADKARVVEIIILDSVYGKLKVKTLSLKQAKRLEARIRGKSTQGKHKCNADVVEGPLNGNERITQHKFESSQAELALNDNTTKRRFLQ